MSDYDAELQHASTAPSIVSLAHRLDRAITMIGGLVIAVVIGACGLVLVAGAVWVKYPDEDQEVERQRACRTVLDAEIGVLLAESIDHAVHDRPRAASEAIDAMTSLARMRAGWEQHPERLCPRVPSRP